VSVERVNGEVPDAGVLVGRMRQHKITYCPIPPAAPSSATLKPATVAVAQAVLDADAAVVFLEAILDPANSTAPTDLNPA
jgi:hypothetical protein